MESLQRKTKREQITEFFVQNMGTRFRTDDLHRMFGTAFRTRVSEINRNDGTAIRIVNEIEPGDERRSSYYAEWK